MEGKSQARARKTSIQPAGGIRKSQSLDDDINMGESQGSRAQRTVVRIQGPLARYMQEQEKNEQEKKNCTGDSKEPFTNKQKQGQNKLSHSQGNRV